MPTVLRVKGFRFYFYSSDRLEPCHVHVAKGDGVGKVWLEPLIEVQYLEDFNKQEKRQIIEIIEENKTLLKEKWNEFFGK